MTDEELIARLRMEDRDRYLRHLTTGFDTMSAHKARAERMEAALREIAAEASVPVRFKKKGGIKHKWMHKGWRKIATDRIDIARAALKGESHD